MQNIPQLLCWFREFVLFYNLLFKYQVIFKIVIGYISRHFKYQELHCVILKVPMK